MGMEAVLRKTDAVITAYRAHGWTYMRGVPMSSILSELTGDSGAVCLCIIGASCSCS